MSSILTHHIHTTYIRLGIYSKSPFLTTDHSGTKVKKKPPSTKRGEQSRSYYATTSPNLSASVNAQEKLFANNAILFIELMATVAIIAGATGAATTLAAAPAVVSTIGFTSAGIASGSTAAAMMSTLGGAATPAGGLVATCQAIGALSSVTAVGTTAVVVTGGVGVGIGAVGYGLYKGIRQFV